MTQAIRSLNHQANVSKPEMSLRKSVCVFVCTTYVKYSRFGLNQEVCVQNLHVGRFLSSCYDMPGKNNVRDEDS